MSRYSDLVEILERRIEMLERKVADLESKQPGQWNPIFPNPVPNMPQGRNGNTCSVCGMFFEYGKTYGYACPNSNCPSQVVSYSQGTTT